MGLSRDLSAEVGRNVRRIRDAHGAGQADLVYASQRFGLDWTQSTVAKVEAGTRGLTAEELVVLPLVLGDAVAQEVRMQDLVDADFQMDAGKVMLGGGAVRALLSGEALTPRYADEEGNVGQGLTVGGPAPRSRMEAQKMAAHLRCATSIVERTALKLWGHGVLDERMRREEDEVRHLDDERSRQAARGHITRALLDELRQALAEEIGQAQGLSPDSSS